MNVWLTVQEAAPLLGMSEQGIYSAVREGQLPSNSVLRIGRRIRINIDGLVRDQRKADGQECGLKKNERQVP